MPDHQVCHAHCPPKAAAGGGLVALIVGGLVLSQVSGPVAAGLNALVHALLMVLMWIGIAVGSMLAAYVTFRVVRWRRAVSHAPAAHRRAMPRYRRRAVSPAPLELTRPVSRVTAVTIKPTEAKVKR